MQERVSILAVAADSQCEVREKEFPQIPDFQSGFAAWPLGLFVMGIFSSGISVQGVVAVLLSSGLLELWKADPICWHLTCTVQADFRGNLETIDVVTAWK